jgi:hypothetical protein
MQSTIIVNYGINLTGNTSKTKVVIFAKGKVRRHPSFLFGDEIIEVVDDYISGLHLFRDNCKLP